MSIDSDSKSHASRDDSAAESSSEHPGTERVSAAAFSRDEVNDANAQPVIISQRVTLPDGSMPATEVTSLAEQGEDTPATDEANRISSPSPANICAGCRELTARIERLEKLVADQMVGRVRLGTTQCYWICVGVHSLVLFCLSATLFLWTLGLALLIGACGTLTVCHVFSTRTIPQKTMRTLLSVAIVMSSGLAALGLQDAVEFTEFLPTMLCIPLILVCSWFVAKLFVWIRGWRLVPPGHTTQYPKLQIRHLLFCTLSAALYLAVARFAVDDVNELLSSEMLAIVLYGMVPVAMATVLSSVLARIILSERRGRLRRNLLWFATTVVSLTLVSYLGLVRFMGEDGLDFDTIFITAIYTMFSLLCLCASPAFTFVMLRLAGYRWVHP